MTLNFLNNSQSLSCFILKSILAGITIGFGCIVYVLQGGILGSFLFSLALLTVVMQNMNLYTGKIGYIQNIKDFMYMMLMAVFNFIGIGLFAWMMTFTTLDYSSVNTIIQNKLSMPDISSFILAICCGVMMYIAVDNFKKVLHPFFIIMPIMLFILCGFEHCIANVGYFVLGQIDVTWDNISKVLIYVAGNAVGSLVYSKLNPS